ncbi:hypothetical protein HXX76_010439 [Chlamydomonas incerta]|uniref:Uncharacterized protein n=1 Tax=Chlamydomonas incerta TaxID=51695 RepID=A0A835SJQ9_CHLIN|nr:hypothetical protein HXX76_010439 [Chlamydomonas incerta]|eukprot:KAG2428289.1 hypothetical protein HXX76_010439 [Chlamydomonas incerta]
MQPWPGHAFVAHWRRAESWRALTLPERERLLCLAASSGHAASLDAALAQCGCALKPAVLTAAAAAGNLAGCERLLCEGCSFSTDALTAAARGGHLPALQLLLTAGTSGDNVTGAYLAAAAQGACAGGQLPVLAWLQQAHGYSPRPEDVLAAAQAGQVAVLDQLLPRFPDLFAAAAAIARGASSSNNGDEAAADASATGRPEDAAFGEKWQLLEAIIAGCPAAVLQRHYDGLWRWRAQAQPEAGADALEAAAAAAERDRGAWFDSLLDAAIGSGTDCWSQKLEYLLSRWGPTVAGLVLCSAHARGLRAASRRPDFAARLPRLRALGVPLGGDEEVDAAAVDAAARGGHADALAWVWDEAGGGMPPQLAATLFAAAGSAAGDDEDQDGAEPGGGGGRLAVLRLLRERGLEVRVADVLHVIRRLPPAAEQRPPAAEGYDEEEKTDGPGQEAAEQEQGEAGEDREAWRCCRCWSETALLWMTEVAVGEDEEEEDAEAVRGQWSEVFGRAAARGAGLPLLRALRARGAAVGLGAVAEGGSEEALEWAAAELEAKRGASSGGVQALSPAEATRVLAAGNAAALVWLRGRGLLPPLP